MRRYKLYCQINWLEYYVVFSFFFSQKNFPSSFCLNHIFSLSFFFYFFIFYNQQILLILTITRSISTYINQHIFSLFQHISKSWSIKVNVFCLIFKSNILNFLLTFAYILGQIGYFSKNFSVAACPIKKLTLHFS
jgi:hypothetical protein